MKHDHHDGGPEHSHQHGLHDHHHHGDDGRNILVAFFLNAGFSIIEFIGGFYTNSVAIYSDALHDLGDSLSLIFAYFSEKLSKKDPDTKFTFGYRRFSLLAALINGLILFAGSLFVLHEAIIRLMNPEPVKAEGMIYLAILGLVVNSFAAYKLSKNSGLNSKMVMYHLLEDLLGWAAVLLVSIILVFKPWYFLDSILSILISLIILRGVYKNLKKVGLIFLQHFPKNLSIAKLRKDLMNLEPMVTDVHALRGWSIDGESSYLRFHVALPADTTLAEADRIKKVMRNYLEKEGVQFSTIEFESNHNPDCSVTDKVL